MNPTKRYKPYDACLNAGQMKEMRKKFRRDQKAYWSKIKEVRILHINDFYRVFLEFRFDKGSTRLFELKSETTTLIDFHEHEFLGMNKFKREP
jgi:hypothetical protein